MPDKPRLLKNLKTGKTFAYSEALAKRPDMALVKTDEEIEEEKKARVADLKRQITILEGAKEDIEEELGEE